MSNKANLPSIVKSIIKTRKALLRSGRSYKNTMMCHKYIKSLSNYIDAYEKKWNEEGWRKFVIHHIGEIVYLIPENKSGQTIKQKLYESI